MVEEWYCDKEKLTLKGTGEDVIVIVTSCISSFIDGVNMSNDHFTAIKHYEPSSSYSSGSSGGFSSNNNNNNKGPVFLKQVLSFVYLHFSITTACAIPGTLFPSLKLVLLSNAPVGINNTFFHFPSSICFKI